MLILSGSGRECRGYIGDMIYRTQYRTVVVGFSLVFSAITLGLFAVSPCSAAFTVETDDASPRAVEDLETLELLREIGTIPDAPGSLVNRFSSTTPHLPVEQWPRTEQVASELKQRFYDPDRVSEEDQNAFVRIARREPASVLTDHNSMRSDMYRYVLNAMLEQDRLSLEDEHWVRSVHQLRVSHRDSWFKSESAYARVEVRRLVRRGRWKIRINRRVFVPDGGMGEDFFRALRPEGLAPNSWWDGLVEVYTPVGGFNSVHWGGTPPTTFDRKIEGMIYEGDPYADIWWPVAKIKHDVEFTIASRSATDTEKGFDNPEARYDAIDGSEVIEDPSAYVVWLERNMKVRMERGGTSFWREGMPDSFCLTLEEGAQKTVKLPAFTFGGRATLYVVIGVLGADGEPIEGGHIPLRECDGVWWALRDEPDLHGGRKIEHEWLMTPFIERRNTDRYPTLMDNHQMIRAYIEVRMGTNQFGHQDMRAVADPEQQRLLTETVRLPIGRGDLDKIEVVLRSEVFSPLRDEEW